MRKALRHSYAPACARIGLKMCKLMIDLSSGMSPLDTALDSNSSDVAKLLQQHGVSSPHRPPLHGVLMWYL
jgi:hypothetical protein